MYYLHILMLLLVASCNVNSGSVLEVNNEKKVIEVNFVSKFISTESRLAINPEIKGNADIFRWTVKATPNNGQIRFYTTKDSNEFSLFSIKKDIYVEGDTKGQYVLNLLVSDINNEVFSSSDIVVEWNGLENSSTKIKNLTLISDEFISQKNKSSFNVSGECNSLYKVKIDIDSEKPKGFSSEVSCLDFRYSKDLDLGKFEDGVVSIKVSQEVESGRQIAEKLILKDTIPPGNGGEVKFKSLYSDTRTIDISWKVSIDGSVFGQNIKLCEINDCSTSCLSDKKVSKEITSTSLLGVSGKRFYGCLQVYDRYTNNSDWVSSDLPIEVRKNIPRVVRVATSDVAKTYKTGDRIIIEITFSSDVFYENMESSNLKLKLNIPGTQQKFANYFSGSGSKTLKFSYEVRQGDDVNQLDYLGVDSLIMDGTGFLKNLDGESADLKMPDNDNLGSLKSSLGDKVISIDTTAPIINKINDILSNKSVIIEPKISGDHDKYLWEKESGPGALYFSEANSLSPYVSASSDGSYVIKFTAIDKAGNSSTTKINFRWDTVPPQISGIPSSLFVTNKKETFSPNVSSEAVQYKWSMLSGTDGGILVFSSSDSKITSIEANKDGLYVIRFSAEDKAGNSSFKDFSYKWDTTPPVLRPVADIVTNSSRYVSTDYQDGQSFNWVQESGPVGGKISFESIKTTNSTISSIVSADLDGEYVVKLVALDSLLNSSFIKFKFKWDTIAPLAKLRGIEYKYTNIKNISLEVFGDDLINYRYSINKGGECLSSSYSQNISKTDKITAFNDEEASYFLCVKGIDEAGNIQKEPSIISWIYDISPPHDLNFAINRGDLYTNNETVNLSVNSSDASSMYITNNIDCLDGGVYEPISKEKLWTLSSLNQKVSVYIKFKDEAGNESKCISDSIIHDNLAPTAIISNTPDLITSNENYKFSISGNDVVKYKYAIVKSSKTCDEESYSDIKLAIDYVEGQLVEDGTYTLCVKAYDTAGNLQDKPTIFSWDYDKNPPKNISIIVNSGAETSNDENVSLALTADDSHEFTMYITNDDTCNSGGVYEPFNNTKLWKLSKWNALNNVHVKFKDLAGNETECISDSILHDNEPPVAIVNGLPSNNSISNMPNYNFIIEGDDVYLYKYKIISMPQICDNQIFDGESIPFSQNITGKVEGDNIYMLCVKAIDKAGNIQTNPTVFSWTYDVTKPMVLISTIDVLNTGMTNKKTVNNFVATLTENSINELTQNNFIVENGRITEFSTIDSRNYKFSIEAIEQGLVKVFVDDGSFKDLAGNFNIKSEDFSWRYDSIRPEARIWTDYIENGEHTNKKTILNINVDLSESPLRDLKFDNFYVINGLITDFSGKDKKYRFSVEAKSDGDVFLNIKDSSFMDLAGNNNIKSNEMGWVYDSVSPSIILSSTEVDDNGFSNVQIMYILAEVSEDLRNPLSTDNFGLLNCSIISFERKSDRQYLIGIKPIKEGLVSVYVEENKFFDIAGNYNIALSKYSWIFDVTKPEVIISSTSVKNGDLTNNLETIIEISLSESALQNLTADNISIINGSISDFYGNDRSYSFKVRSFGDGLVSLLINSNTFKDKAGNFNNESNNLMWNVDITRPSILAINSIDVKSGGRINQDISLVFELSEMPKNNLSTSDFSLKNASILSLSGSGLKYTLKVKSNEKELPSFVYINENTVEDKAGNFNLKSEEFVWTYDIDRPDVKLSTLDDISNGFSHKTIRIYASISEEPLYSLSSSDFYTENAEISDFSGSSKNYSFLVSSNNNGQIKIGVNKDKFSDLAGNGNNPTSKTWINDLIEPSVIMEASQINQNGFSNLDRAFTVVLSEEPLIPLNESDFKLNNGTIANFNRSGLTYSFLVKAISDGQVSCYLPYGSFKDRAGNKNIESEKFNWIYDNTNPSVVVYSNDINNGATTNKNVFLKVDLSERPLETLNESNFLVNNGYISDIKVLNEDKSYLITVTPLSEGLVKFIVPTNSFTDLALNKNTVSNELYWNYDSERPVVLKIESKDVVLNGRINKNISVLLSLSESPKEPLTVDNFLLNNCRINAINSIDDKKYELFIESLSENNPSSLYISEGSFQDKAGNLNIQSDYFTYTYDIKKPSVLLVPLESFNDGYVNKDVGVKLVLSESPSRNLAENDINVINGSIYNFYGNDREYFFSVKGVNGARTGLSVKDNIFMDLAGNFNTISNEIVWFYDNEVPNVRFVSSDYLNNGYINIIRTFTVELSESPLMNLKPTDFTVENGYITNFSGTDKLYTFNVISQEGKESRLSISDGSFKDKAGNLNKYNETLPWIFDSLSPGVVISSEDVISGGYLNRDVKIKLSLNEEPKEDLVASLLSVINGSIISFSNTNDKMVYEAIVRPDSNGEVYIFINEGLFQDIAGNLNIASNRFMWNHDTVKPNVVSMRSDDVSDGGFINKKVNIKILLSEMPKNYLNASNFKIENGSILSVSTDGLEYSLLVSGIDGLQSSLSIIADSFSDLAGNLNSESNKFYFRYDGEKPSSKMIGSTTLSSPFNILENGGKTRSSTSSFTIDLSEAPLNLLKQSSLIVSNNASIVDFKSVEGSLNKKYTFTLNVESHNSLVTISIPSGSFKDLAGNDNIGEEFKFTHDSISPEINIYSYSVADAGRINQSSIVLYIEFSEKLLKPITLSDFSLDNLSASNLNELSSEYNSIYSIVLTSTSSDAASSIGISSGKISDLAGNINLTSKNFSFIYDGTMPFGSISSFDVENNGYKNVDKVKVILTLNEEPSTLLTSELISISNGLISNFAVVSGTKNKSYEFDVTANSEGVVTVSIPKEKFKDLAGNDNIASSPYTWMYDKTPPSVNSFFIINSVTNTTDLTSVPLLIDVGGANRMYITRVPGCESGGVIEDYSTNKYISVEKNIVNTIYAKFLDLAGNSSPCVSDAIYQYKNPIIPEQTVNENSTITLDMKLFSEEGATTNYIYSCANSPCEAGSLSSIGVFSWTPGYDISSRSLNNSRTININVKASNGLLVSNFSFTVKVINVDRTPRISVTCGSGSVSETSANGYNVASYSISDQDPEDSASTYISAVYTSGFQLENVNLGYSQSTKSGNVTLSYSCNTSTDTNCVGGVGNYNFVTHSTNTTPGNLSYRLAGTSPVTYIWKRDVKVTLTAFTSDGSGVTNGQSASCNLSVNDVDRAPYYSGKCSYNMGDARYDTISYSNNTSLLTAFSNCIGDLDGDVSSYPSLLTTTYSGVTPTFQADVTNEYTVWGKRDSEMPVSYKYSLNGLSGADNYLYLQNVRGYRSCFYRQWSSGGYKSRFGYCSSGTASYSSVTWVNGVNGNTYLWGGSCQSLNIQTYNGSIILSQNCGTYGCSPSSTVYCIDGYINNLYAPPF